VEFCNLKMEIYAQVKWQNRKILTELVAAATPA
jgi:hypothetical protein